MALRERDIAGVLGIVAELADVDDLETYAERSVEGLLRLFPTDVGHSFNELRQEPFAMEYHYGSPGMDDDDPDHDEILGRLWRTSPTSTVHVGTCGGVYRWSDLRTPSELDALEIYQLAFASIGHRHLTKVVFPSGPYASDAFMLARNHEDFADRDVEILQVLYPFLLVVHRSVHANERARAIERALVVEGRGVVLLHSPVRIAERLGLAEQILRTWFDPIGDRVPETLCRWIAEQEGRRELCDGVEPSRPLIQERDGRRLVVRYLSASEHCANAQLLLEEHSSEPDGHARGLGLTAREVEILRCVAEGRTNREVADELFIAATTVADTWRTSSSNSMCERGPLPCGKHSRPRKVGGTMANRSRGRDGHR